MVLKDLVAQEQQSVQKDDTVQNEPQKNDPVRYTELIAQLQQLKTKVFSGSLTVETDRGLSWIFYFRLGRLSWAVGGANPEERWKRNLAIFCPHVGDGELKKLDDIVSQEELYHKYRILGLLQNQKLIERQQLLSLIMSVATEVLFDAIQYCQTSGDNLSYKTHPDNPNSKLGILLPLLSIEEVINSATEAWQKWQTKGLAAYSPNLFPVIQQPEIVQKQISASAESAIISLADGAKTLRTLAQKSNRDIIALTEELIPLVNSGAIALSEVPSSTKINLSLNDRKPSSVGNNLIVAPSDKLPLIACVDDSPSICQAVENIINERGYRFIGIQDSLKVIPTLLKQKPDFIFLDLLMPILNGYEVCTQLRRAATFQEVPIVILTGKDGLVDRMRAKLVGSTDFLSKPVEKEQMLKMLDKHLKLRK